MYYNQPRNGNSAHESGTANCPCTAFASYYPQNRPILPPIPMPFCILPRTLQERMHIPVPLPSPLAQIMHILLYSVTYSRHLNLTDFEVGASCSIALQGKAKTGYPRVSRGSFFIRLRIFSVLLCTFFIYSFSFFQNIDRRIHIPVHPVSTFA